MQVSFWQFVQLKVWKLCPDGGMKEKQDRTHSCFTTISVSAFTYQAGFAVSVADLFHSSSRLTGSKYNSFRKPPAC